MQQIFDKVIGQQNLDTLYTLGFILLSLACSRAVGRGAHLPFADTTNQLILLG